MNKYQTLGIYRAMEPKEFMLQPAWKIDNSMELHPGEILISVKIISLNLASFNEIGDETDFVDALFRQRIMDIIEQRGKLHNPITGTGGMLFGTVKAMDPEYANYQNLCVGDNIISLSSLSVTPISIDKIISVDYESAQIVVEGKCILFTHSPLFKIPKDLPLRPMISALDEAGAPTRAYQIIHPGDRVLIMGATGKIGLLCAYAAMKKLNGSGEVVGLVLNDIHKEKLVGCGLFSRIIATDATDMSAICSTEIESEYDCTFDIVINCINRPYTELSCLEFAKYNGTLFFATLSNDYKLAALTAESIGKDVTIIPYSGYVDNHANFTLDLLREYPKLQKLLTTRTLFDPPSIQAAEYNKSTSKRYEKIKSDGYVFNSIKSQETLRQALKVARYNSTCIIYGESGTGKEIIANIIHQNSERKSFPLIKINCAAIPESLLESELFGYEKGSFTGANTNGKKGLWEAAQNGTLFLDEVGDLPFSFQAKLLRAIQEKEITRIGGITPIKTDVRIIAATNRNLAQMVREERFRDDLYYRLNVFPIYVAPLRERREDIVPLAKFFVGKYNKEFNLHTTISPAALNLLSAQNFSGNIRELQNMIQQTMININCDRIESSDILHTVTSINEYASYSKDSSRQITPHVSKRSGSLKEMLDAAEREILCEYQARCRTTQQLADALRTSQSTIVRKLHKYKINLK